MLSRSGQALLLPVFALLLSSAPRCLRGADLNSVLDRVAAELRAECLERDLKTLRLGRFENAHSSAGRRIETELIRRLEAAGIPIVGEGAYEAEVRGELNHYDAGEYAAATLITSLYDADGDEIESFRRRLDAATDQSRADLAADLESQRPGDPGNRLTSGAVIDNAQDVALLHGATVDVVDSVEKAIGEKLLPPKSGGIKPTKVSVRPQSQLIARVAVDRSIRDAIVKPGFHLREMTRLGSGAESPFRIELLVTERGRSGPYTPVPLIDVDGRAYAELQEGQYYAVRIHNDSPIDVGVELNIDGINSLALSQVESYRRIGKWVVAAGGTGLIRGWQTARGKEERFLVTTIQQSVAASLGRPQEIGMVTAAFYPAWTGDEPPPYERLVAGSTRRIATGRGPVVNVQDRSAVRSYGTEPLSLVTVRYRN